MLPIRATTARWYAAATLAFAAPFAQAAEYTIDPTHIEERHE